MAPPLAKKNFFWHTKKIGKLGLAPPPLCVSTSGQRKIGPPPLFEILNTPLVTAMQCNIGCDLNKVTIYIDCMWHSELLSRWTFWQMKLWNNTVSSWSKLVVAFKYMEPMFLNPLSMDFPMVRGAETGNILLCIFPLSRQKKTACTIIWLSL